MASGALRPWKAFVGGALPRDEKASAQLGFLVLRQGEGKQRDSIAEVAMRVNKVMTRGVQCARPNETLQKAAQKMRELYVGPLPVCGDNDRLVGMLTDRDITVRAVAEGWDPKSKKVSDAMTPDVVYCFEDQDVTEVAEVMKTKQLRRLVVLNQDKRLVGIVSLGDLATDVKDEDVAAKALEGVSTPGQANS